MTVRKGEPMDHLTATDEEFDALLDASSLGAPHVVAETGDIPATARRRMVQAVQEREVTLALVVGNSRSMQYDEADSCLEASNGGERTAQKTQSIYYQHLVAHPFLSGVSTGKSGISTALLVSLHRVFLKTVGSRPEPAAHRSWIEPLPKGTLRSTLWLSRDENLRRGTPRRCSSDGVPVMSAVSEPGPLWGR
ncbi:hypothetical protein [Streptomyces sp. NPDC047000]|uniref:hypothetical protein n=1 Tax=Streptomyces sp. NPDC047000 TaxID=3155474 RepID=UPI00340C1797